MQGENSHPKSMIGHFFGFRRRTFPRVCQTVRESVYGIIGTSQVAPGQVNASNGTAFMIAPGILVTAAHQTHINNNPQQANHSGFEVIRAPDIGQVMEVAALIAEDSVRDIALLRIQNQRSNARTILNPSIVPMGVSAGSLGFPLANVSFSPTGKQFNLTLRFQGASISSFQTSPHASGRQLSFYETDALMYSGSSGCPGFLIDGIIFGMHVASIVQGNPTGGANPAANRVAISLWVPSPDIIAFVRAQNIQV